ncbi:hypothetical protein ACWCPD_33405 [Streptomyces sp. NPDC001935]|uniref:hypothetical protein n=1 Tax=Streptomyces sp. NPDC056738 TaxID=3345933 RepID=UPI0036BEE652
MTSTLGTSSARSRTCPARLQNVACDVDAAARHQLWWTAQQTAGQPERPPVQADHLRQWAGVLIDALLGFDDDIQRLPGPQADVWRRRMSFSTRHRLSPVTGNLPTRRWLVHARQRTHIRLALPTDRRLYQLWVPHLVDAVRGLVGQSAAAAAQSRRSEEDPGVTAHLLNARHNLLHACLHLNRHTR